MNIGLFFGSFNPIHHGHLIIGTHVLQNEDVDQVWFIVSPQNPFKVQHSLLNEYHRLHLTRLAIEGEPGFRVSDIEFKLSKPSYSIDTLEELRKRNSAHVFSLIMGSDSLMNIEKWKRSQDILRNYRIYVYPRDGFPIRKDIQADIVQCDAPILNISASLIRSIIKGGKSVRYYVPEKVREEIELGHYYK